MSRASASSRSAMTLQTISDMVTAWQSWNGPVPSQVAAVEAGPRPDGFRAGVEIAPDYHPSWTSLFPDALQDIQTMNANLLVLTPTWSYGRTEPGNNPPLLSPQPERDASWFALNEMLSQASKTRSNLALYPQPNFHSLGINGGPVHRVWIRAGGRFGSNSTASLSCITPTWPCRPRRKR